MASARKASVCAQLTQSWQRDADLRAGFELFTATKVWPLLPGSPGSPSLSATEIAAKLLESWEALPEAEQHEYAQKATASVAYRTVVAEQRRHQRGVEGSLRAQELECQEQVLPSLDAKVVEEVASALAEPNRTPPPTANLKPTQKPASAVQPEQHPFIAMTSCMTDGVGEERGLVHVEWPSYWDIVYSAFFTPPAAPDVALGSRLRTVKHALEKSVAVSTMTWRRMNSSSLVTAGKAAINCRIEMLRKKLALQQAKNELNTRVVCSILEREAMEEQRTVASLGSSLECNAALKSLDTATGAMDVCPVMLPASRKRKSDLFRMYKENLTWAAIVGTICRGMCDRSCRDANAVNSSAIDSTFIPPSWTVPAAGRVNPINPLDSQKAPMPSSVNETDDVTCAVCFNGDSLDDNQIVLCDRCDIAVHQACFGLVEIPSGDFFCDRCAHFQKTNKIAQCALCPVEAGALKPTTCGKWVHVTCALCLPRVWITDVLRMSPIDINCNVQRLTNERATNLRDAVAVSCRLPKIKFSFSRHLTKSDFSKIRNRTCAVCGQCNGRTVSCSVVNCPRSFHILCAWYEGLFIRCQKDNIAKVGCGRLGGDDFTFDVFCSTCTPDVFQDFSQSVSRASRRRFRDKEKRLVQTLPRVCKRSPVDEPEVLHQAAGNAAKRLAQAVAPPDVNASNSSDKPQAAPLPPDRYSPTVCAVCFNAHPVPEAMIGCARCNLHVHPSCGAVELTRSAGAGRHGKGRPWVCAGCDAGATDAASLNNSFLLLNRSVSSSGATTGDASSHSVRCLLCPRRGGVVLPSAQIASMFVHIACSIHVPGCSITSDGRIATPTQPAVAQDEPECYVCKHRRGYKVPCVHDGCGVKFHPLCGLIGHAQPHAETFKEGVAPFRNWLQPFTDPAGQRIAQTYCHQHHPAGYEWDETAGCWRAESGMQQFNLLQRVRDVLEMERTMCDLAKLREKLKQKILKENTARFESIRCQLEPTSGPCGRQSRATLADKRRVRRQSQHAPGPSAAVGQSAETGAHVFRFESADDARRWRRSNGRGGSRRFGAAAAAWIERNCPTAEALRVRQEVTNTENENDFADGLGFAMRGEFVLPAVNSTSRRTSGRAIRAPGDSLDGTKASENEAHEESETSIDDCDDVLLSQPSKKISQHTRKLLAELGLAVESAQPESSDSDASAQSRAEPTPVVLPRSFSDWYDLSFSANLAVGPGAPSTPAANARSRHLAELQRVYCLEIVKRVAGLRADVMEGDSESLTNIGSAFIDLPDASLYPNYYSFIKKPTALRGIRDSVVNGEFENFHAFDVAVRRIFRNAQKFNQKGSPIFRASQQLEKFYTCLRDACFDRSSGQPRLPCETIVAPAAEMGGFPARDPDHPSQLKLVRGAGCSICSKSGNEAQILLCDRCDHEFHLHCLVPALTRVPSGDFWCPRCLCDHGAELVGRRIDIKDSSAFNNGWRTGTIVRILVSRKCNLPEYPLLVIGFLVCDVRGDYPAVRGWRAQWLPAARREI
eukprot:INCI16337.10.p1 GENE.INCI16337.10~~INCI16337.10.p1  ORF type:complete len:1510 (-),score=231.13 INCI16337.10:4408-8937(-)